MEGLLGLASLREGGEVRAVCKSALRWLAGRPAVGLANQSHVIGPTNQLKTKYSERRGHGSDFTGPTRFLRLLVA